MDDYGYEGQWDNGSPSTTDYYSVRVCLDVRVVCWCAENLLSHFFVIQPSPSWQLNIKKPSSRSNTVWVMAFGTVCACDFVC